MTGFKFYKNNCMPIGTQITIDSTKYTVTDFVIADDRQSVTYTVTAYDRFAPGGIRDRRKLVKRAVSCPVSSKCA